MPRIITPKDMIDGVQNVGAATESLSDMFVGLDVDVEPLRQDGIPEIISFRASLMLLSVTMELDPYDIFLMGYVSGLQKGLILNG